MEADSVDSLTVVSVRSSVENLPKERAVDQIPQLPVEIWLSIFLYLEDPRPFSLLNKTIASSILISPWGDDEESYLIPIVFQSRYLIARFGSSLALASTTRYSFFTKGTAHIASQQTFAAGPALARGQCQFCSAHYKLEQQLRLQDSKQWFRGLRKWGQRVWLHVWKLIQIVARALLWIGVGLHSLFTVLCCYSMKRRRKLDIARYKMQEMASVQTLNNVLKSTKLPVSEHENVELKSICGLERYQMRIVKCLLGLGAKKDSMDSLIKYAAQFGHFHLLTMIIDIIAPCFGPEMEGEEPRAPAWLLSGELLCESVRRQNYRLLEHLCKQNAALPANNGYEAVRVAVEYRDTKSMRILVNNGAKFCVATQGIQEDIEHELLISNLRMAMIKRVFGIPLRDGSTNQILIEGLIRCHESVNQAAFIEFCEAFLVPMLVEVGSAALMRAIWERGADLDINDSAAIYFSTICGHWRVVRFLTHEVATIRVTDLEKERRKLKYTWRLKKKFRGSFLIELIMIYLGLLLKKRRESVRIVPDAHNSTAITIINQQENSILGATSESLEDIPDLSTLRNKGRFFDVKLNSNLRHNIRVSSVIRGRRAVTLICLILLHIGILSWFLYNLAEFLISIGCYAANVGRSTTQTVDFYEYDDGYITTYYYYSYDPKADSSVQISGWCEDQLGTTFLDQDYWFKNGAVMMILLIAVFIAERTMPLHGIFISLAEVVSWLWKRRILNAIVRMRRL